MPEALSDDKSRGYRTGPFTRVARFRGDLFREAKGYWLFPQWTEVDMSNVIALRERWKQENARVTFTAFVVKAIADALKVLQETNPELNAAVVGFPWRRMVYFEAVDVAVAAEKQHEGEEYFHVGIIRNAGQAGMERIAAELRALAEEEGDEFRQTVALVQNPGWLRRFILWLSRNTPSLVKKHRGTVFLSSVGKHGVNGFAMTNHNLSFSFGGVEERAAVVDGAVAVRPMMTLTMVIDHRVINGTPAARLLALVRARLEEASGFSLD